MTILRSDAQDESFERESALGLTEGDGAGGLDVENQRITALQIGGICDGFRYAHGETITPFCELGFQDESSVYTSYIPVGQMSSHLPILLREGPTMAVIICMLRGVNLGSHNRVKMEELKKLCESLKLREPQTYVQSGNVLFKTDERDLVKLAKRMEGAIPKKFGFQTDAVLRSTAELRDVVARNPFAKRRGIEPSKLLVTFFGSDPGEEARVKVRAIKCAPDEFFIDGREAYIYFASGAGRPTLSWPAIPKKLKVSGTARNWNSVTKMLEMAERMEVAG
jgi:uncharacterized protein (DUF1697 family)